MIEAGIGIIALMLFLGLNGMGKKLDNLADLLSAQMRYEVEKNIGSK